ncbi:NmrA family NAD(P)-binding protein [Thermoleophilia bacterium SCSIO 60948]|nr:NmrA family NAD(P)-binding protein [Thermoleophilia bacterium SCSIO 60948]
MRILVTGATGFVGRNLVPALLSDGHEVRCLVRDPDSDRARALASQGAELTRGDLTGGGDLGPALGDIEVAYFLVHLMGSSGGAGADGYEHAEVAAARRFAEAAKKAGVERVIYLGGLGSDPSSPHLSSRHATALALEESGPPLVYMRAGMAIGSGSDSYVLVRSAIERLVAVPDAGWLHTESQPIGIRDLVAYLRLAVDPEIGVAGEVELGGPDVIEHLDMLDATARALGRRPPRRVPAPLVTPEVMSAAARSLTKGDPAVAAELILSLPIRTVVEDPAPARRYPVRPEPLAVALQRAIEADERG